MMSLAGRFVVAATLFAILPAIAARATELNGRLLPTAADSAPPAWEADLAAKDAACRAGDAQACQAWFFALDDLANAGLVDAARKQDILMSACEAGNAYGCSGSAIAFKQIDPDRYRAIMIRTCDLAKDRIVAIDCWHTGNLLTTTEPVDLPTARWAYGKGCELQNGCFEYGTMLRDGLGGENDKAGALAAFVKQCDADQPDGCQAAAELVALDDPERSAALHKKACSIAMDRQEDVDRYCAL